MITITNVVIRLPPHTPPTEGHPHHQGGRANVSARLHATARTLQPRHEKCDEKREDTYDCESVAFSLCASVRPTRGPGSKAGFDSVSRNTSASTRSSGCLPRPR